MIRFRWIKITFKRCKNQKPAHPSRTLSALEQTIKQGALSEFLLLETPFPAGRTHQTFWCLRLPRCEGRRWPCLALCCGCRWNGGGDETLLVRCRQSANGRAYPPPSASFSRLCSTAFCFDVEKKSFFLLKSLNQNMSFLPFLTLFHFYCY